MKKCILNSVPKEATLVASNVKQGVNIYTYSLIYRSVNKKGDIWTITEYEENEKKAVVALGNGPEIPPAIRAVKMQKEDLEESNYHHETTNLIEWESRLGHRL